ncbi:MAG: hypothetical protein LKM35_01290 [Lachnospiraceae bacterium]|nr:hypothetical protein [Lachnospiraceae bacterium]MCI1726311.1 hypothetical protein [Lachnospiraceae bacterium]
MKQPRKWYKLDNAAAIVPSSAHGADTRVFRLSCELREEVNPELLQQAVDLTMKDYPYFRSVLRKGLFWYYLDSRDLPLQVEEEKLPACSPLYFPGRKSLLLRVLYYRKRISLEIFHVLADGLGAFLFFRELILTYLSLCHHLPLQEMIGEKSTAEQKTADAFRDYYRPARKEKKRKEKIREARIPEDGIPEDRPRKQRGLKQLKNMTMHQAWHMKGELDPDLLPHLVEGTVSAKLFLAEAKKYGVSAGVFSVSLYIASAIEEMEENEKDRQIVVSVPVDLRKYFPSETVRNFFGVINVAYQPRHFDGTPESILSEVKASFAKQLEPERIERVMNSYAKLEHNFGIRIVPLTVKDGATQGLSFLASQGVTCTFSNLGVIRLPEEAEKYVEKASVFATAPYEQICAVTFGDRLVFGEMSPYVTHGVMCRFFRKLVQMGIPVEIATNDYEVS